MNFSFLHRLKNHHQYQDQTINISQRRHIDEMEVEDWDMSTRLLYGLRRSSPSEDGLAEHYPDSKIQHELKAIAVRLYNHQKMTPMFANKVTDGKNTLAYLLCASYESSPSSSPETNSRLRLRNCTPLPLEHWDRLYYIICTEIRSMYSALEEEFGKDFESGATILHNAGPEGISGSPRHPVSGVRLARILEDMWTAVTHERLTGPLSAALDGRLINTDGMDPEEITEMVFTELATATPRRSDDETLLGRARAELRSLSHSPPRRKNSKHVTSTHCRCDLDCYCREICDLQPNECGCTHMREQICEMMEKQHNVHNAVQAVLTRALTGTVQTPNHLLGEPTNNIAQLQIASMAQPEPSTGQACNIATEDSEKYDAEVMHKQRKRTNTNNSELAYVPPPRTPTRGKKDAYPLGFYGDSSGHRYPTFRNPPSTASAPPPVYGSSFCSSQIPARKPIPRSASKAEDQSFGCDGTEVSPSMPQSESKGLYTQSFPVPALGNPRNPIVGAYDDAQSYADLAEEAHNVIRPFSDEPDFYMPSDDELTRPAFHTTATAPANIPLATNKAGGNPSSIASSINKPFPPLPAALPEPEFIRPRPAMKQRYVSAGGNLKLSDREEISGPAMSATISSRNSGVRAIPKEQLFEMLNDPDFVRANFGEEAVGKMAVATPPASARPSVDNSPSKNSGLRRSDTVSASRDSKVDGLGYQIKRERTESGGSFTGKLKRVFSRKNSQIE